MPGPQPALEQGPVLHPQGNNSADTHGSSKQTMRPRWECSPANILISALWNPEWRTQLCHGETSDLQKLRQHSCGFKSLSLWSFVMQQQKTNTDMIQSIPFCFCLNHLEFCSPLVPKYRSEPGFSETVLFWCSLHHTAASFLALSLPVIPLTPRHVFPKVTCTALFSFYIISLYCT